VKRKLTIDPMPRQDLAVPPPIGYVARADYDALTAERDRLKAKVARQAEQITGLEASRRKLESLTAGAHRRVAQVEAERDECKRVATHSEDVVRAARVEIERLREAAIALRDDMMERARIKIDVVNGEEYRIVNAGRGAWENFCAALKGQQP
jgi:chromosome segregation ATPase